MDNKKTFKFRNIQGTVNGQYERTAPLFSRRAENYNETLRDVAAREQKQAFIELVKPPPESTDEKVKRIASEIDASLSSLALSLKSFQYSVGKSIEQKFQPIEPFKPSSATKGAQFFQLAQYMADRQEAEAKQSGFSKLMLNFGRYLKSDEALKAAIITGKETWDENDDDDEVILKLSPLGESFLRYVRKYKMDMKLSRQQNKDWDPRIFTLNADGIVRNPLPINVLMDIESNMKNLILEKEQVLNADDGIRNLKHKLAMNRLESADQSNLNSAIAVTALSAVTIKDVEKVEVQLKNLDCATDCTCSNCLMRQLDEEDMNNNPSFPVSVSVQHGNNNNQTNNNNSPVYPIPQRNPHLLGHSRVESRSDDGIGNYNHPVQSQDEEDEADSDEDGDSDEGDSSEPENGLLSKYNIKR